MVNVGNKYTSPMDPIGGDFSISHEKTLVGWVILQQEETLRLLKVCAMTWSGTGSRIEKNHVHFAWQVWHGQSSPRDKNLTN